MIQNNVVRTHELWLSNEYPTGLRMYVKMTQLFLYNNNSENFVVHACAIVHNMADQNNLPQWFTSFQTTIYLIHEVKQIPVTL